MVTRPIQATVSEEHIDTTKAIHRRTGRTFYYATRLLPERVRRATYVLYAFFRVADEVVDDDDPAPPAEQYRRLDQLRDAALGRVETGDPVLAAFAEVRDAYDIPEHEVDAFVDAMKADVATDRYETFDDLREYMRGSAAAVGAMMTHVMSPADVESALPRARRLGEAFQLTNFLRDVREDATELDRVYLPVETLEVHGASPEAVLDLEPARGVRDAVEAELLRAETLYRRGVAGIDYLPTDCQLPVLTAAVLYADHHRLIRDRGFDTVTATPSLSTRRKLWLVARTRWHWLWTDDPEAVFARVSAVPASGRGGRAGPVDPTPAD
jgi:phytoene synthase